MADLDRVKRNLSKMIDQGAPESDLNTYLQSEGFKSPDSFKAAVQGIKPQGRSDAVANAFGQGATFNFGDELTAAVRAALPGFSNWMMRGPDLKRDESLGGTPEPRTVSTAPTFDQRYEDELNKVRLQTKVDEEQNPNLMAGANIAGNAAATTLLLGAAPAGLTSVGPSLTVNALKGAAVGGGLGAITGYGAGEGDTRAGNALFGGTVGAATGGAVPVILAGGEKLLMTKPVQNFIADRVTPATRTVAGWFGGNPAKSLSAAADGGQGNIIDALADKMGNMPRDAAIERLTTAVQRSGRSLEDLWRQYERYGPQAVIADLDENLLTSALGIKVLPGQTKTSGKQILEARERTYGNALKQAAEGSEPPPSHYAIAGEGKGLDSHLSAVGNRLYSVMDDEGLKQSLPLREMYENPYVKSAMDSIMATEKNSRIGRPNAKPDSPVSIMHKVKRAIWDMGFDKDTARPGPTMGYYRDVATDFMDELKRNNPALKAADIGYSEAASLPDFYQAGINFLSKGTGNKAMVSSAPALDDLLGGANALQRITARAGSTNAIRAVADEGELAPIVAMARRLYGSDNVRAKLVELYGPEQAQQIMLAAERVGVFNNTGGKFLRGSQTAEKTAAAAQEGATLPDSTSMISLLKQAYNWAASPGEQVRDAMGSRLINNNPEINRETFRLMQEALARRNSRNALRSLAPAEAGALASRRD